MQTLERIVQWVLVAQVVLAILVIGYLLGESWGAGDVPLTMAALGVVYLAAVGLAALTARHLVRPVWLRIVCVVLVPPLITWGAIVLANLLPGRSG